MLKQCTAFFLLLAVMASTFSRVVIVVDFYANRAYISKYLCVNRNSREIIDCGGQCHLTKNLNKEAEQDKSNPERSAENKSEIVFFEELSGTLPIPPSAAVVTHFPRLIAASPVDRAIALFRPPCA